MPNSLPGSHDVFTTQLPNGITLWVRENQNSPAVVLDGTLRAGSAIYTQRAQAGLASLTASMLMRGSIHTNFEQIHEQLESCGANLSVSSNIHTVDFGGKCLSEDLPFLLRLSAEVLRAPAFPADHFEKLRSEYRAGHARRNHSTRAMANLVSDELLYGREHPYAIASTGYPDTINALTLADVANFHQQHYGPRGAIIVIVGAITPTQALEWVTQYFGDWQNPNQPEEPTLPAVARLDTAVRQTIAIPGKTQSDFVLQCLGPTRAAEDFQAARLANNILGVFGMMGRLGDIIRNRQGLAYYAYSSLSGSFGPGPWTISAGVNPANVEKAVQSALNEIKRLTSELVTETELSDTKQYVLGRLPISLETNEDVAGTLSYLAIHDLGVDYLQGQFDRVNSVTRAQVLAAAQHYLSAERYALAIAG
jgi:zinc protease